jgi:hypothetical protein
MNELTTSLGLSRRELLHGAILLIGGASSAMPTDLFASAAAQERFFDKARFGLLDAVCEAIIPKTDTPGGRDAGVPAAFDALMQGWASPERRRQFTALLDAFDAAAVAESGKALLSLPPEQQADVVAQYDAAKFRSDAVYAKFKELVVRLYYLSEAGATQELRFELVPGAWEPAMKITDHTRAWADPSNP